MCGHPKAQDEQSEHLRVPLGYRAPATSNEGNKMQAKTFDAKRNAMMDTNPQAASIR